MSFTAFIKRLFGGKETGAAPDRLHFAQCKPLFDNMDRRRKVAFFAITARQLLPLYLACSSEEPWQDPELMREAMALLDKIADGGEVPTAELNRIRKRLANHVAPEETGELETPAGIVAIMNAFSLSWYLAFAASGDDAALARCFLGNIYEEADAHAKDSPGGCAAAQRERELRLLRELAALPGLPPDWRERFREFGEPLIKFPNTEHTL